MRRRPELFQAQPLEGHRRRCTISKASTYHMCDVLSSCKERPVMFRIEHALGNLDGEKKHIDSIVTDQTRAHDTCIL